MANHPDKVFVTDVGVRATSLPDFVCTVAGHVDGVIVAAAAEATDLDMWRAIGEAAGKNMFMC